MPPQPTDQAKKMSASASMRMGSLRPGMRAVVSAVQLDGLLYRRLLDLGLVENAEVQAVLRSPTGDPAAYRVRGAQVALRKSDADMVHLKAVPATRGHDQEIPNRRTVHARPLVRSGQDISKAHGSRYLVALSGNPNTGKSTVFNALTGLRQHVGNWPGKTVTRAEGQYKFNDSAFTLVDLPGTYSLISNSIEEEIARDFIVFGQPDCTAVIVDATCLERNLNLVLQILQITRRVVVCVNLLDEARRKGLAVDLTVLEGRLGVPVVGTEARNGVGLDALRKTILEVACGAVTPHPVRLAFDDTLERAISDLTALVRRTFPHTPNPRWIALRLIDGGDTRLLEEVRAGLLADHYGCLGSQSLP